MLAVRDPDVSMREEFDAATTFPEFVLEATKLMAEVAAEWPTQPRVTLATDDLGDFTVWQKAVAVVVQGSLFTAEELESAAGRDGEAAGHLNGCLATAFPGGDSVGDTSRRTSNIRRERVGHVAQIMWQLTLHRCGDRTAATLLPLLQVLAATTVAADTFVFGAATVGERSGLDELTKALSSQLAEPGDAAALLTRCRTCVDLPRINDVAIPSAHQSTRLLRRLIRTLATLPTQLLCHPQLGPRIISSALSHDRQLIATAWALPLTLTVANTRNVGERFARQVIGEGFATPEQRNALPHMLGETAWAMLTQGGSVADFASAISEHCRIQQAGADIKYWDDYLAAWAAPALAEVMRKGLPPVPLDLAGAWFTAIGRSAELAESRAAAHRALIQWVRGQGLSINLEGLAHLATVHRMGVVDGLGLALTQLEAWATHNVYPAVAVEPDGIDMDALTKQAAELAARSRRFVAASSRQRPHAAEILGVALGDREVAALAPPAPVSPTVATHQQRKLVLDAMAASNFSGDANQRALKVLEVVLLHAARWRGGDDAVAAVKQRLRDLTGLLEVHPVCLPSLEAGAAASPRAPEPAVAPAPAEAAAAAGGGGRRRARRDAGAAGGWGAGAGVPPRAECGPETEDEVIIPTTEAIELMKVCGQLHKDWLARMRALCGVATLLFTDGELAPGSVDPLLTWQDGRVVATTASVPKHLDLRLPEATAHDWQNFARQLVVDPSVPRNPRERLATWYRLAGRVVDTYFPDLLSLDSDRRRNQLVAALFQQIMRRPLVLRAPLSYCLAGCSSERVIVPCVGTRLGNVTVSQEAAFTLALVRTGDISEDGHSMARQWCPPSVSAVVGNLMILSAIGALGYRMWGDAALTSENQTQVLLDWAFLAGSGLVGAVGGLVATRRWNQEAGLSAALEPRRGYCGGSAMRPSQWLTGGAGVVGAVASIAFVLDLTGNLPEALATQAGTVAFVAGPTAMTCLVTCLNGAIRLNSAIRRGQAIAIAAGEHAAAAHEDAEAGVELAGVGASADTMRAHLLGAALTGADDDGVLVVSGMLIGKPAAVAAKLAEAAEVLSEPDEVRGRTSCATSLARFLCGPEGCCGPAGYEHVV